MPDRRLVFIEAKFLAQPQGHGYPHFKQRVIVKIFDGERMLGPYEVPLWGHEATNPSLRYCLPATIKMSGSPILLPNGRAIGTSWSAAAGASAGRS